MTLGRVAVVATLTEVSRLSCDLLNLQQFSNQIGVLQVRADRIGEMSPDHLRAHFSGKLWYTLRSRRAGGYFGGSPRERQKRLLSAARDYDLVEIESHSDLSPEVLNVIPARKRVIFWEGTGQDTTKLAVRFHELSRIPAHSYCMVKRVSESGEALRPLQLLKTVGKKNLTAYCEGPGGLWSRLLSPHFGSQFIFGHLGEDTDQNGEPAIRQLLQDYGFPEVRPVQKLFGIVGNRVFQSPSPRLHNAGYRALNYPGLFVPFHVKCFEEFWRGLIASGALESLGVPILGLTIVSPFKEAALAAAGKRSPMVCRAGASNLFVCKQGVWEAHTTDPESIAGLEQELGTGATPMKAAIIGCGGAGRAVAAALQQAGAQVTLVNRGTKRGDIAVQLLGLPFVRLADFCATGFGLLVNATPVGQDGDSLPFAIDSVGSGAKVIDLAYAAQPTALVSSILTRGGTVIDGHDVLLTQVRKQFEMMIGHKLPVKSECTIAIDPSQQPSSARGEALSNQEA